MNKATWFPITTAFGILASSVLVALPAKSLVTTLADNNSTATFDNENGNGFDTLVVDNVNQLFQLGFYGRVGSSGGEFFIGPSPALTEVSRSKPAPNQATALYQNSANTFQIQLSFMLNGGTAGSRTSTLIKDILVSNISAAPLDFHLFEYTDLDLNDTASNDTATITGGNTATQTDPTMSLTTVVTPTASHFEVGNATSSPPLADRLIDNSPTTLADIPGPRTGDTNYAFQFDFSLAPSQSFSVRSTTSNSSVPVPFEPSPTLGLLILGAGAAAHRLKRQLKN